MAKHLRDDVTIRTAQELEQALTAFAIEIGTTVITSADYATVFTLIGEQRAQLSELESRLIGSAEPEDAVAERLAHFRNAGILDAPDPRLAADHFNALTILLAYNNQPSPSHADPDQVRRTMTAGVHAFMRAYALDRDRKLRSYRLRFAMAVGGNGGWSMSLRHDRAVRTSANQSIMRVATHHRWRLPYRA